MGVGGAQYRESHGPMSGPKAFGGLHHAEAAFSRASAPRRRRGGALDCLGRRAARRDHRPDGEAGKGRRPPSPPPSPPPGRRRASLGKRADLLAGAQRRLGGLPGRALVGLRGQGHSQNIGPAVPREQKAPNSVDTYPLPFRSASSVPLPALLKPAGTGIPWGGTLGAKTVPAQTPFSRGDRWGDARHECPAQGLLSLPRGLPSLLGEPLLNLH